MQITVVLVALPPAAARVLKAQMDPDDHDADAHIESSEASHLATWGRIGRDKILPYLTRCLKIFESGVGHGGLGTYDDGMQPETTPIVCFIRLMRTELPRDAPSSQNLCLSHNLEIWALCKASSERAAS